MAKLSGKQDAKADLSKFYFVSCSVNPDAWEHIAGLYPTAEHTFDFLAAVLADGLKVSFAVNGKNDLTICSLTDRREGSASFGACLTGGADGWYDALRVVAYKYTALLHGELGTEGVPVGQSARII